jgi:hypothetical protein
VPLVRGGRLVAVLVMCDYQAARVAGRGAQRLLEQVASGRCSRWESARAAWRFASIATSCSWR